MRLFELRVEFNKNFEEYTAYFAQDAALDRRFEVLEVEEPSVDEAVQILRKLRREYATQKDQKLSFSQEILRGMKCNET